MPLSDKNSGVVNALGQAAPEDLSLEPSLQEVLDLQCQHVIETHPLFVQYTNAHESSNQGITLEQTFGVLDVQFQQFSSRTTNLGENEGDAPDFAFVP